VSGVPPEHSEGRSWTG